jgi:hypothetical protein
MMSPPLEHLLARVASLVETVYPQDHLLASLASQLMDMMATVPTADMVATVDTETEAPPPASQASREAKAPQAPLESLASPALALDPLENQASLMPLASPASLMEVTTATEEPTMADTAVRTDLMETLAPLESLASLAETLQALDLLASLESLEVMEAVAPDHLANQESPSLMMDTAMTMEATVVTTDTAPMAPTPLESQASQAMDPQVALRASLESLAALIPLANLASPAVMVNHLASLARAPPASLESTVIRPITCTTMAMIPDTVKMTDVITSEDGRKKRSTTRRRTCVVLLLH